MALRTWFFLAATVVTLSGCAATGESPAAPPSFSEMPSGMASASGLAPAPGRATITGEVVEGVEPGCLLLKTADTLYLLIGGDRTALQVGKRLTVVGAAQPGLMSTCQQGTPFQVTSVQAG